jgi:hypothetical protein
MKQIFSLPVFPSVIAVVALMTLSSVQAQVYRWVDPSTGQTIYSDVAPPRHIRNVTQLGPRKPLEESAEPSAETSFAIREATRKFPVRLWTTPNHELSDLARAVLVQRGVPFNETVVQTDDEANAMKNLTGETNFPLLSVGRQNIRGFSEEAYQQALDLAGYPKSEKKKDTGSDNAASADSGSIKTQ